MKVALDTNLLAYAEGVNGADKRNIALDLLRRLPADAGVIPVQVLGELFNLLVRKAGRSRDEAREALLGWRDAFSVVETSGGVMQTAVDLATSHRFGIWDAVILSASSQAGCRLLLSEDMQEGFTWGGVTVVNPFAEVRHMLLDALLDDSDR
ncbi:PilT domain-containing protein [Rhizobium gallicum]|uniref:PilT domain-containing protein n=1 Tax=Rhizobium gallicum TaxID=56730 RepID=A0A1L5NM37_9HYPH|nr:PIN domain-containing protein [Rhizobium gallicum]APO68942.1 PilT domain-containing protein [Rhizobium gallicum]